MLQPIDSPGEEKGVQGRKQPHRLGRRRRRVIWTVAVAMVVGLGGVIAGVWHSKATRSAEYTPGEEIEGITRDLDRGAAEVKTAGANAGGAKLPGGAPMPRFVDVTREAGLADFRTFAGNRTSQLPEDMGSGAAWGDYDNDGDEDLFLVSAGGPLTASQAELAPSRLYQNQGGRFTAVSDFPETRIRGMGVAWGDFNRDGRLDLAVSGYNTLLLFRNEGGKFVKDPGLPSPKGFWAGVAWGDYDRDGDLDLYVCGYVRYVFEPGQRQLASKQFGLEVPYTLNPSSYEPERNLLFRNDGNGRFTEVAARLGVHNPTGRSLSALWHDFDGNGWPDLYVANDISESKFYLNHGARFTDAGQAAWVGEYRGSMGLATADHDRDGDDDLFISHWIAQQYALYDSLLADQKIIKAGAAAGGRAPVQGLHFMDVAEMKGIGQPTLRSIGWGTEFADFDADGWQDLIVANGSTFETADSPRRLVTMPAFLFWNQRGKFFYDIAPASPPLATPRASRGLAVADYNNDGALDVLIVDHPEGVRLLRNEMQSGNWLQLRLRDRVGRQGGIRGFGDGATVIAETGGTRMRRSVASASYLSQSSRMLHFGLGKAAAVDRLEVHWPSGRKDVYTRLEANAVWELLEDDPVPRLVARPGGAAPAPPKPTREQLVQFWNKQRAGMDALKREGDIDKAAQLFREALALDPSHEDSRYYLANCLAAKGDVQGALGQLEELARINPYSHRACQRSGVLIASQAASDSEYAMAEKWLQRALALNPEETGTLLILGEIALVRGDRKTAQERFDLACRTNPRAVGGLFLRGYLAWKRGEAGEARELLKAAHAARGKDWKPKGSAAEGDVARRMHVEGTLLSTCWESWNGTPDPAKAYEPLKTLLRRSARAGSGPSQPTPTKTGAGA